MYFDASSSCDVYNLIEAGIWIGMGGVVWARGVVRKIGGERRVFGVLAVFLILFGISDLVEIQTNAWWRPWWLLVWKGVCLAAFAGCGYWLWKGKKSGKPPME